MVPADFHLGLATFELVMRGSDSLKDKRRIVHAVKDRLRRLGVSVAEIGAHDRHQRATLAVACVGVDRATVLKVFDEARKIAESREGGEVWNWSMEWR